MQILILIILIITTATTFIPYNLAIAIANKAYESKKIRDLESIPRNLAIFLYCLIPIAFLGVDIYNYTIPTGFIPVDKLLVLIIGLSIFVFFITFNFRFIKESSLSNQERVNLLKRGNISIFIVSLINFLTIHKLLNIISLESIQYYFLWWSIRSLVVILIFNASFIRIVKYEMKKLAFLILGTAIATVLPITILLILEYRNFLINAKIYL